MVAVTGAAANGIFGRLLLAHHSRAADRESASDRGGERAGGKIGPDLPELDRAQQYRSGTVSLRRLSVARSGPRDG
jgi:hypothetical protein